MTVTGAQEETYTIIIELCKFQRPETMGLIMLSPGALAEGAGLPNATYGLLPDRLTRYSDRN